MENEQTNQTNEKEQTSGQGTQEEKTLLERAEAQAGRIEAANAKTEELLMRQEKLAVKTMLGGRSSAGEAPVAKTEEQQKVQGAKDFFKGTELENAIDKL